MILTQQTITELFDSQRDKDISRFRAAEMFRDASIAVMEEEKAAHAAQLRATREAGLAAEKELMRMGLPGHPIGKKRAPRKAKEAEAAA